MAAPRTFREISSSLAFMSLRNSRDWTTTELFHNEDEVLNSEKKGPPLHSWSLPLSCQR